MTTCPIPEQPGPHTPLVIGVTGHRDLRPEDIPTLEIRVEELLSHLRHVYPDTPWIVLSPLAEGADRLVARVARRCFREGDRLIVPMPMPRSAYAEDFTAEGSLAEFDSLAEGACMIDVMPDSDTPLDFSQRAVRSVCYRAAGLFIVQRSDILIALWDKRESTSDCGTARMVEYRLNGLPPEFRAADAPVGPNEVGSVHVIVTPRRSSPPAPEDALQRSEILPGKW